MQKHSAKQYARRFLSVTRKAIGGRRTHWAVIPAKANPCRKKTLPSYMFAMGLRLREDGAAGRFEVDFRLPVGFNCRI
jgi:hypothetical protein